MDFSTSFHIKNWNYTKKNNNYIVSIICKNKLYIQLYYYLKKKKLLDNTFQGTPHAEKPRKDSHPTRPPGNL